MIFSRTGVRGGVSRKTPGPDARRSVFPPSRSLGNSDVRLGDDLGTSLNGTPTTVIASVDSPGTVEVGVVRDRRRVRIDTPGPNPLHTYYVLTVPGPLHSRRELRSPK